MNNKPLYIERFFLFLGYTMHHRLVRLLFCSFLLIAQWFPAAAQSPSKYKEIDAFIKGEQLKVTAPGDIRVFGRELSRLFTDDEIKARAAFFWLTQHIKYDCEGYRNGNRIHEPAEVLATGKSICAGYAHLFKLFCDALGLESEIIHGFAFNYSDPPVHADSLSANHAWNAVKIKGQWKLLDATWGSGTTNTACTEYHQQIEEAYFLADPHFMISRHWPEDEKWQLLEKPFTARQFADSAAVFMKSVNAFNDLFAGDSIIKRKVGELVRLRLPKEDLRNFFSVLLYDKNDSLVEDLNVPVQISKDGFYYCDYKVKRSGSFELVIALYYLT